MSINFFFPVPLLVEDVDPAVRDAIHAKVTAYLGSDLAKRDIEVISTHQTVNWREASVGHLAAVIDTLAAGRTAGAVAPE